MNAIVSVHDVMPETWSEIQRIVDFLSRRHVTRITLLVVPGKPWRPRQIEVLRHYTERGIELAGHGWSHRANRYGGLYHRLHALLLSRQAAEHLALISTEIASLVSRCHAWFHDHALPAPELYVPPAWAMGSIQPAQLSELPFRYYEFLSGVYDSLSQRFVRFPVLAYQADRVWRVPVLIASNALNQAGARLTTTMVRIAVHPGDLDSGLAKHLDRDVRRCSKFLNFGDLDQQHADRP